MREAAKAVIDKFDSGHHWEARGIYTIGLKHESSFFIHKKSFEVHIKKEAAQALLSKIDTSMANARTAVMEEVAVREWWI